MTYLIILLVLFIILLLFHIYKIRKSLQDMVKILDDIYAGNLDRRLLVNPNTEVSNLVYKINEIVISDKNKLLELNKALAAYKRIVTSLSHNIRTPLSSLIGYLEVLEKNKVKKDERQLFLQISKRKALDLNDYIQTLFEWLKLESGEWVYELKKNDICELTRLILAEWIIKFEQNNIDFEFEIPEEAMYLSIDKKAFTRIINNLLINIVKHSQATKIKITIYNAGKELQLIIADNGIGIEKKDLPFIFDRLYQCDASRATNSNGLGLAIAKELTTALNGSIDVSSCYNKGTTFSLKFKNMNKI